MSAAITPARFRRLPNPIDAVQFHPSAPDEGLAVMNWINERGREATLTMTVGGTKTPPAPSILNLWVPDQAGERANVTLRGGEWITVDETGQWLAFTPDGFASEYEPDVDVIDALDGLVTTGDDA